MKQILILEQGEITRLQKGKTLMLSTAGGEVGIQFAAYEDEAENGTGPLRCKICGATRGLNSNAKPFTKFGLKCHMQKAHGK